MHFPFQLFTFTDITDCLYSHLCVFNINLCVFDSLSAIRHEGELSLVLMCCVVTAAFCVHASDVCAQKTVYQKYNLMPLFHCVVRLGMAQHGSVYVCSLVPLYSGRDYSHVVIVTLPLLP